MRPSASIGPVTIEMPSELRKRQYERAPACRAAGAAGPGFVGYARDFGLVRVQIADRVWSGADGAYNRSLSRVVTNA